MRRATLLELAAANGIPLPDQLRRLEPLSGPGPGGTSGPGPRGTVTRALDATDERGWFRFQRLYDAARAVVRTEHDVRRLVLEAAQDDAAEGSGWLELQVDPSTYARHLDGLTATVELILDAAHAATARTGVGIGLVLAANRTRHPLDARTLARLAARYAHDGVVGFGLSNDERRGHARDFDRAFRIARDAGLAALPHGGELGGPAEVRDCLRELRAHRIGHGVRAAEDPTLVAEIAASRVTLEVCPASNVALGVAADAAAVPVRELRAAGVPIALGADDPLLFGSRLVDQYVLARDAHGCSDADLAALARDSVEGSLAPEEVKVRLRAGIVAWLASDPPGRHGG